MRLSLFLFQEYRSIAKFKAYFCHVYICAKRDYKEVWYELPYLVTREDILLIITRWYSNFLTSTEEEARKSEKNQDTEGAHHENLVTKKDKKMVPQKVTIDLKKNTA